MEERQRFHWNHRKKIVKEALNDARWVSRPITIVEGPHRFGKSQILSDLARSVVGVEEPDPERLWPGIDRSADGEAMACIRPDGVIDGRLRESFQKLLGKKKHPKEGQVLILDDVDGFVGEGDQDFGDRVGKLLDLLTTFFETPRTRVILASSTPTRHLRARLSQGGAGRDLLSDRTLELVIEPYTRRTLLEALKSTFKEATENKSGPWCRVPGAKNNEFWVLLPLPLGKLVPTSKSERFPRTAAAVFYELTGGHVGLCDSGLSGVTNSVIHAAKLLSDLTLAEKEEVHFECSVQDAKVKVEALGIEVTRWDSELLSQDALESLFDSELRRTTVGLAFRSAIERTASTPQLGDFFLGLSYRTPPQIARRVALLRSAQEMGLQREGILIRGSTEGVPIVPKFVNLVLREIDSARVTVEPEDTSEVIKLTRGESSTSTTISGSKAKLLRVLADAGGEPVPTDDLRSALGFNDSNSVIALVQRLRADIQEGLDLEADLVPNVRTQGYALRTRV